MLPLDQAPYHRPDLDTPIGVRLGIEEDLSVAHPVGCRPAQIGRHQLCEVVLRLQHLGGLVVDVEKRLQIVELVSSSHFFNRAERQRHAVALPHLEHHLRLEGSLDVNVQLGLGKAPDEIIHSQVLLEQVSHLPGRCKDSLDTFEVEARESAEKRSLVICG